MNQLLNFRNGNAPVDSDSSSSGNIETEDEDSSASEFSEHENAKMPAEMNNVDINAEVIHGNDHNGNLQPAIPELNLEDVVPDSDADERVDPVPVVLNEEEKEQYLIRSLREWGSSGGVLSMRKIDALLGKLSLVFRKVPKSYKTLLSTALNLDADVRGDYKMWYKGIAANLNQWISSIINYIRVFRVRGLHADKSSVDW